MYLSGAAGAPPSNCARRRRTFLTPSRLSAASLSKPVSDWSRRHTPTRQRRQTASAARSSTRPPRACSRCPGSREGRREAFTGETTGQVLSRETGLIPRCRSHSVKEKATSSHGEWLAWEEPRAVRDLVHVEKFFARNLGSPIHARTRVPGRLGKATSRPLLSTPRGCLRKSVF
jgi:hypothetical protein